MADNDERPARPDQTPEERWGIFLLHEVVTELAMENHCFWSVNQRYINVQFSIAMLNELPEGRFYCSYNMLQIVRWVEVTIVKSTYNYGAHIVKFLMFMEMWVTYN